MMRGGKLALRALDSLQAWTAPVVVLVGVYLDEAGRQAGVQSMGSFRCGRLNVVVSFYCSGSKLPPFGVQTSSHRSTLMAVAEAFEDPPPAEVLKRGVAAVRSAQRGTSGAATGGGAAGSPEP
jgi:hypothetical protein